MTDINHPEIQATVQEIQTNEVHTQALAAADFCNIWPKAKAILEALAAIPKLSFIVKMVIMIGDGLHAKCP